MDVQIIFTKIVSNKNIHT